MALRIYVAGLPDAAAIAALHLASYRAAYQDLLPARFLAGLSVEDRERRWRASLADPRRRTLIARGDGSPAPLTGFAEIGPSRDDDAGARTGELMALHVTQSRWRQGTGRMLHDAAMTELAAWPVQSVTLWVLTGNSRARAFYEAMGWHHDGTARQYPSGGIEIAEVRYRVTARQPRA